MLEEHDNIASRRPVISHEVIAITRTAQSMTEENNGSRFIAGWQINSKRYFAFLIGILEAQFDRLRFEIFCNIAEWIVLGVRRRKRSEKKKPQTAVGLSCKFMIFSFSKSVFASIICFP